MANKIKMNGKNEEKTLEEAFKEFLQYSKAKNLTDRTLEYYEYNYNRFKEYLENEEIEYIHEIDQKVIQQFIISLQKVINKGVSINNVLRAVRAFLYYCMKMNYLDNFKVEMVKTKKTVKKTYTDTELELLLEKPDVNDCSFAQYRNWVIFSDYKKYWDILLLM